MSTQTTRPTLIQYVASKAPVVRVNITSSSTPVPAFEFKKSKALLAKEVAAAKAAAAKVAKEAENSQVEGVVQEIATPVARERLTFNNEEMALIHSWLVPVAANTALNEVPFDHLSVTKMFKDPIAQKSKILVVGIVHKKFASTLGLNGPDGFPLNIKSAKYVQYPEYVQAAGRKARQEIADKLAAYNALFKVCLSRDFTVTTENGVEKRVETGEFAEFLELCEQFGLVKFGGPIEATNFVFAGKKGYNAYRMWCHDYMETFIPIKKEEFTPGYISLCDPKGGVAFVPLAVAWMLGMDPTPAGRLEDTLPIPVKYAFEKMKETAANIVAYKIEKAKKEKQNAQREADCAAAKRMILAATNQFAVLDESKEITPDNKEEFPELASSASSSTSVGPVTMPNGSFLAMALREPPKQEENDDDDVPVVPTNSPTLSDGGRKKTKVVATPYHRENASPVVFAPTRKHSLPPSSLRTEDDGGDGQYSDSEEEEEPEWSRDDEDRDYDNY